MRNMKLGFVFVNGWQSDLRAAETVFTAMVDYTIIYKC